MRLVALAGGTGAAKLLRGLSALVTAQDLTIIGNTGDDLELFGLHISPDLDTVAYTLSGTIDTTKGWGVAGDTFHCRAALAALGEPTYFGLGDRDLAVHLLRTERLRQGVPLSRITAELCFRLKLEVRLLPMSDEPVRTRVLTPGGWLAFQEFFVRERCAPQVLDVAYEGAAHASPGPGVIDALLEADAILICPSNPVSSVGPILAVPGIREVIAERQSCVTAVSPIVGGSAVGGPAADMMRAKGYDVSPAGVADAYAGLLARLVIDHRDAAAEAALRARGVRAVIADSMMTSPDKEIALARAVLEAAS